ncbi:MCE family protein [Nocardioides sp.]|uniref:MCE family protein n=1 Tax=Nocardioides sp. TaxID=35761 RepID=UPI0026278CCE|nr:MCE family protein [Nocardioides sp.]
MSATLSRRVITTLVILMVIAAAFGIRELLKTKPITLTAYFDSTVGLYAGSDVQVLGVPVGKVTHVEANGGNVKVTMNLDPSQPVAADTKAVIIAPTMVSDRFVQLTDPWAQGDGDQLKSGAVINQDRTAVPVEIDDLYSGLTEMADAMGPNGANKNGALSNLLKVAAANMKGEGSNLNQMVGEFGKASATLSNIDDNFFGTLDNLNTLNTMLVDNDAAVAKVNRQFADVAGYLADDKDDMSAAAKNLSGAMAVLDGFLRDNQGALATSLEKLMPTVKTLRRQQKSLDETVKIAPLLLHNLRDSYNEKYNVIGGRGNVNEVTIWADSGLTARTSASSPPTMLDGASSKGTR